MSDAVFCKDCKYSEYTDSPVMQKYLCTHTKSITYQDLVSGFTSYTTCSKMRACNSKCCVEGRLYEEKEDE